MFGIASAAASLQLQLSDLQWGAVRIAGFELQSEPNKSGWRLNLNALAASSFSFDQIVLDCRQGTWALSKPNCEAGQWQLVLGGADYQGQFSISENAESAKFSTQGIQLNWSGGQLLELIFEHKAIAGLEKFWSTQPDWPTVSDGVLDGTVRLNLRSALQQVEWDLQLSKVGFDNQAGDLAAVNLGLMLKGQLLQQAVATDKSWEFKLSGGWNSGEMLFGANYLPRPESQVTFGLEGIGYSGPDGARPAKLILEQISFDDPGALQLSGSATWNVQSQAGWRPQVWKVTSLDADVAGLIQRYLSGALGKVSLGGVEASGSIGMLGGYGPDQQHQQNGFVLTLRDISLNDAQSRFSVNGLQGRLNWRPELGPQTDSLLSWEQLQIYQLPLDAAVLHFALGGDGFTVQPKSSIGFLGAGLMLHELQVSGITTATPAVNMDAELLPMELVKLTKIMGWPSFGGQLAGRIPGVELSDGVWQLAGQLALDVFGGQMVLSSLSAERPFGVLPTFNASIWLDRLQLEPLTAAFEIGRITGPVDGQISNLRLLNWQPVQFDAWLRTSENPEVPLRISQRAVDTISSIGGGVGGGLQSTFLRLFEDFGYRQLGFSCRLLNDICELDGVADASTGSGFLLVDGSGIPKLEVVGHNRRVAWQQMLEQLQAATESGGPKLN